MSDEHIEYLIKQRESALAHIYESLDAVNDDLGATLLKNEKIPLERKRRSLEEGAQAVVDEIKKLKTRLNTHWTDRLHKINFKDAVKKIDSFADFSNPELSLALLIKNTERMGGQWCIKRVRESLNDRTLDFRHCTIELTKDSPFDEKFILRELGRYFDVEFENSKADLDTLVCQVNDKIIFLLKGGNIVLVEINGLKESPRPGNFIENLFNKFWQKLVARVEADRAKYRGIKLLLIFTTTEDIELKDYAATGGGISEMPMSDWQEHEISEWLVRYAGADMSGEEVSTLSEIIYKQTNGTPEAVHEYFLEHLSEVLRT